MEILHTPQLLLFSIRYESMIYLDGLMLRLLGTLASLTTAGYRQVGLADVRVGVGVGRSGMFAADLGGFGGHGVGRGGLVRVGVEGVCRICSWFSKD